MRLTKKSLIMAMILGHLTIFPISNANAEIKTYDGVGEYIMSDFETPDIAKERAKQRAEQAAQEQAGVYVQSFTEVKNAMVTQDEIITMTNGIMQVFDVKYQTLPSTDGVGVMIRATLKANIDTDKVAEWLQKGVGERSEMVAKNKQLQQAIEEQNRQIAELKSQLAAANNNPQVEAKVKEEISGADKVFMSNLRVDEGDKLYDNNDLNGALKKYNEAIELNSQNSAAYAARGNVLIEQKNYKAAISDLDKAIKIDDNQAYVYNYRACAYIDLEDYGKALDDLMKAIDIDPEYVLAYSNGSIIMNILEQYNDAIELANIAIKIDPYEPAGYSTRATAYFNLGEYKKALKDYQKALELDPDDTESAEGIKDCKEYLEK